MIDFFLVGAQKAGTTSIYRLLSQNPAIFVPRVKEPNFYADVGPQKRNGVNVKDFNKYQNLYKKAKGGTLKGDFSVSYMHDPAAPYKIHQDNPDAKIIMILRNPIQRAFSHWLMDVREGFTKMDFIEAFEKDYNFEGKRGYFYTPMYFDCSCYYDPIVAFKKYFGDNVLILIYEDLFKDLATGVQQIDLFLNIPDIAYNFTKENESGVVKNELIKKLYQNTFIRSLSRIVFPEKSKQLIKGRIIKKVDIRLSSEDYQYLTRYFEADVKKVRELLGRNSLWSDI